MVGPVTSVRMACRAVSTIRRINFRSFSALKFGSPHTCSMRMPLTTRLTSAAIGIMGMALIMATLIFSRANSLLIVAPQRLQLPHVATRRAARIWSSLNFRAICSPISLAQVTAVPLPTVEWKNG